MMKRFVSIWFPHLVTDWFTLHKPELKNVPFVLSAASHGRIIITAASPQAQQKGIYPGTVLADARTIYPSLQAIDDKPNLIPRLLRRLAEWSIRFTPCAAPDPMQGILLDASGCSHLWGGDDAYVTEIINRFKERGYTANATIADTIGTAWAEARFGKLKVIETGKQFQALQTLPPEALRLDEETIGKLHKLGLKQIRDLAGIPQTALRRRFGSLIIQRLNQALGSEEEFIEPVYPPQPFHERLPCLEPILYLEGVEIALQLLLKQLCARLQNEGKGVRTANFRGYRADGKTTEIQISTSRPSVNPDHLFHLFQLKLPFFEPASGIELFLLEAIKAEDLIPVQEDFWKEKQGFNDRCLSELVDRLEGRFGSRVMHRYLPDEHYWPERSFKKAASFAEQPATQWKTENPRPIQLLPDPEIIEVTAPIPDYPPMLFRYKGKLHTISKADGPERIEQEWWIQDGEHRDYYAVEDEKGCRYWLFRSGHYDEEGKAKWFIHGFFA